MTCQCNVFSLFIESHRRLLQETVALQMKNHPHSVDACSFNFTEKKPNVGKPITYVPKNYILGTKERQVQKRRVLVRYVNTCTSIPAKHGIEVAILTRLINTSF